MTDNKKTEFKFNIPFAMFSVAKRETGKSYLTKYCVKNWMAEKKFDRVFVMTNTGEVNEEYNYLPKQDVIPRYNEAFIRKLMQLQKTAVAKYGKDSNKIQNVLLILDDVIGSLPAGDETMRELISQGRHYKISLIMNIQISKRELDPTMRANADYFMIGYNGKQVFANLYDELDFPGNKTEFVRFMMNNTTHHNFVIYVNSVKMLKTADPKEKYKIIRAEGDLDKFKVKY